MSACDTDPGKFETLMSDLVQYGALALSLAMAQETGALHVLCQSDTPLTSLQVAQEAGLKERYVRELLGALVAGRLVQLAPGTSGDKDGKEAQYFVPAEQKQQLKKTAKTSLCLSATARQFAAVKNTFYLNGPSCVRLNDAVFSLSDHADPLEFESQMNVFLNDLDLRQKLEKGIDVAELGSGKGNMIRKLAAKFPNSRFTATDAVDGPLDSARRAAEDEGLTNITFRIVDACDSPEDWNEQFDWIFAIMVIHDLPHPRRALAAVKKALKPGGVFSMLDECVSSHLAENIGNGHATFMYTISTFHCIPESFQQDDSEAVGACWGEQLARRMIDEAGLKLLNVHKGEEVGSSAIFTCQKLPE